MLKHLLKHDTFKYLAASVLMVVALYPKFPLIEVPETFVSIRFEDLLLFLVTCVLVLQFLYKRHFPINFKIPRLMILYLAIGLTSLASAIFITKTVTPHLSILHWVRRVEYFIPFFLGLVAIRSKSDLGFIIKTAMLVILIVFILTGLWHGAAWHFIVWGILQALFIILERFKSNILKNFLSPLKYIYTLLAIIISWVFFRSESVGYAIEFLKKLFLVNQHTAFEVRPIEFFLNSEVALALGGGIIFSTPLLEKLIQIGVQPKAFIYKMTKLGFLLALFVISLFYLSYQSYRPFIYFKF